MQYIEVYSDAGSVDSSELSTNAVSSAVVESEVTVGVKRERTVRSGRRKNIDHKGFSYYCQNARTDGRRAVYRCRMVSLPGVAEWTESFYAHRLSKLPHGTERCPGRLVMNVVDGKREFSGGEDHVCNMVNTNCYGVPDDRCVMMVYTPAPTWGSKEALQSLRSDLVKFDEWHTLTGGGDGGTDRVYLPTLGTDPKLKPLYRKVKRACKPYVDWLQKQHPKLKHIKYGLIKTMPRGKSQYELHGDRAHFDFGNEVYRLAPDERPVSMMIALDEFDLYYLPNMSLPDSDLLRMTVHKHNAVKFTNACLHSGAENPTPYAKYRIFMYAVSREVDFPHNQVWISDRTKDGEVRAEARALSNPGSVVGFKKPISVSKRGRTVFEVDHYVDK